MPIATCSCGAKIRLPDGPVAATLRCPRCKAPIHAAAPKPARAAANPAPPPLAVFDSDTHAPTAAPQTKTCPVCQGPVQQGEEVQLCSACGQLHHRDCWNEVGGCAIYGCANAHQTIKPEDPGYQTSAWGDTKRCPACGETIKAIALRCRYCNSEFPSIDPMNAADLRRVTSGETELRSLRTSVIVLFIVSVIGVVAPLALGAGLFWMLPRRQKIARAGPAFAVLGYAAVVLSAVYTLLLVVFAVFSSS